MAAYLRIFERLGLAVTPVEALSGAIGGDVNHEFMVESAIGEDHFVRCANCGYAANVEAARGRRRPRRAATARATLPALASRRRPPARPTIDEVVALLDDPTIDAATTLKSIAAIDDTGEPVVVLVAR